MHQKRVRGMLSQPPTLANLENPGAGMVLHIAESEVELLRSCYLCTQQSLHLGCKHAESCNLGQGCSLWLRPFLKMLRVNGHLLCEILGHPYFTPGWQGSGPDSGFQFHADTDPGSSRWWFQNWDPCHP